MNTHARWEWLRRGVGAVVVLSLGLAVVGSLRGATVAVHNGRIAFTQVVDSYQIWATRTDGTQKTRLISGHGIFLEPVVSRDGRQLAFVSNADGDSEIWVSRVDGSNARQLTQSDGIDWDPAWSPNGRRIAFASERSGDYEIYSMAADGSDVKRLTKQAGNDENPAWSPDGKKIAFQGNKAGSDDIYVMRADGTGVKRLTTSRTDEYWPTWSPNGQVIAYSSREQTWLMSSAGKKQKRPLISGEWMRWAQSGKLITFTRELGSGLYVYVADAHGKHARRVAAGTDPSWFGSRIVYERDDLANYEIVTVDSSGQDERKLAASPAYDAHPVYCPDGATIVFSSDRQSDEPSLQIMSASGENVRQLVNLPVGQYHAAWSPDRTKIAFESRTSALYIYTVATGEVRRIDTYGSAEHPRWAPDSVRLVFASDRGDSYDLYVFDTISGGLRRLTTDDRADEWNPDWSPDGTTILFTSDAAGSYDILSMPSSGGTPHRLTSTPADDNNATWSPDGRLIVFDRFFEDTASWIYTMRPDGTDVTRLKHSPDPAFQPDWQPLP